MGDNQIIYNRIVREQESKRNDQKKKEVNKNKIEKIDQMSNEEVSIKLKSTTELFKMIKYNLEKKKKELKELKRNEEVRKYILINSSINDMNEELESISNELYFLEQKVCNHSLIYLIEYPKKTMAYVPLFRCLSCGKTLTGFIENDQFCVNSDFLHETDMGFHGSHTEFLELLLKNNDYENDGLSVKSRYDLIYNDLKKEHKNGKKIELKRR